MNKYVIDTFNWPDNFLIKHGGLVVTKITHLIVQPEYLGCQVLWTTATTIRV